MKKIAIIAHQGSNIGSIDNPRRAFLSVNEILQQQGKEPYFTVTIIGITKEIILDNGFSTIQCASTIFEVNNPDLIIIPAIDGDIANIIKQSQALIPWLINQYKQGAEIASLCVGAFILASTGLLDGKLCATHWRAAQDFKTLFPKVNLVTDKIITDQDCLYTSAGAFSSANLILYIIEKYLGKRIAIDCAKMFQVDYNRDSQSPFIIFNAQKEHNDEQVLQAQEYIEQNYSERITVNELTNKLAISRRNLERRFKKATTNTLIEYIQKVRIEVVKTELELGRKTVSELMYEVGYSDAKAFRNIFRKITGLTPMAYRDRYQ